MHTCAAGGDRSELCNEKIAQNAFEHGTDHGSLMTFMRYTGPHQMIWFGSKEADCYGFTLYPPEIKRERSRAISHHVFSRLFVVPCCVRCTADDPAV